MHLGIAALSAIGTVLMLCEENAGPALRAAGSFSGKSAAFRIVNLPDLHWLAGLLLLLCHLNSSYFSAAAAATFFTLGLFLATMTFDANELIASFDL